MIYFVNQMHATMQQIFNLGISFISIHYVLGSVLSIKSLVANKLRRQNNEHSQVPLLE